jgi:hypothetical protein
LSVALAAARSSRRYASTIIAAQRSAARCSSSEQAELDASEELSGPGEVLCSGRREG